MIELVFTIIGDEAGSSTFRCLMDRSIVFGNDIESEFPFEGEWHFRVKDSGAKYGVQNEYVWVDLKHVKFDSDGSSKLRRIDVRALPISPPDKEDYGYGTETEGDTDDDEAIIANYYNEVASRLSNSSDDSIYRGGRQPIDFTGKKEKKSVFQKMKKGFLKKSSAGVDSVSKSVNTLWGSLTQGVGQFLGDISSSKQPPSELSEAAEECLASAAEALTTAYSDSIGSHVSTLRDVWGAFLDCGLCEVAAATDVSSISFKNASSSSFQRESSLWRLVGCQSDNPVPDLKSSGLLALQCTAFMCRRIKERCRKMISANAKNVKTNYPFIVVAVNVVEMLAQLLNLRKMKYLAMRASFWALFEAPTAFFELFLLAFCHIDSIWTSRKAVRADFGIIIAETKTMVQSVLDRGPTSLDSLWEIATDEGIAVPVI